MSESPDSEPSVSEPEVAARPAFDRRRWAVVAGALLALVVVGAGSVRTSRDLSASRARISELEHEIRGTEERIDELDLRIDLLQDDPVTLEWLAREELGMARPGEVILALSEELR